MWGSGQQPIRVGLPWLIFVSATCIFSSVAAPSLPGGRGVCKAWEGEGCLSGDHPGIVRSDKGAWDASHGLQRGEAVRRVCSGRSRLQCAVVAAAVGNRGCSVQRQHAVSEPVGLAWARSGHATAAGWSRRLHRLVRAECVQSRTARCTEGGCWTSMPPSQ